MAAFTLGSFFGSATSRGFHSLSWTPVRPGMPEAVQSRNADHRSMPHESDPVSLRPEPQCARSNRLQ
jgi:hypothetical protein